SQNRPREAYEAFSRCLDKGLEEPLVFFTAAVCLMVGLGRFREAMAVFTRANDMRYRNAQALGLAESRVRFLSGLWHGHFGHLAQIDYLVRLNILEGRNRDDTILYVEPGTSVPNRF